MIKHILTQGDSMMLAALSTLEDQGIYALAANYGGLIARMFFQPIEESTRSNLGKLLAANKAGTPKPGSLTEAKLYLHDILRIYGILSILVCSVGPTTVPLLLRFLIGSQWSQPEVLSLLSLYCYYIPFLAFNGITEAFVSSVANNSELRQQSAWMGGFSAGFAAAAYLFLKVCRWGVHGLIWANIVNMAVRIVWSYWFINRYFRKHNNDMKLAETLPRIGTSVVGVIAYAVMLALRPPPEPNGHDALKTLCAGGACAITM
jgi:oligosaccharide translocation protein RFT1